MGQKRFTKEEKAQAVRRYCNDKKSLQEVANEFGVTRECVRLWINSAGKQTRKHTSSELFKNRTHNASIFEQKSKDEAIQKAVELYTNGHSVSEIREHIKVTKKNGKSGKPSLCSISNWLRASNVSMRSSFSYRDDVYNVKIKHRAKELYNEGFPLRTITETIQEECGKKPSIRTVYLWLKELKVPLKTYNNEK